MNKSVLMNLKHSKICLLLFLNMMLERKGKLHIHSINYIKFGKHAKQYSMLLRDMDMCSKIKSISLICLFILTIT